MNNANGKGSPAASQMFGESVTFPCKANSSGTVGKQFVAPNVTSFPVCGPDPVFVPAPLCC